jgi:hypothetical protein
LNANALKIAMISQLLGKLALIARGCIVPNVPPWSREIIMALGEKKMNTLGLFYRTFMQRRFCFRLENKKVSWRLRLMFD